MVMSAVSPRRWISDSVLQSVFAYCGGGQGDRQPVRCSFYAGPCDGEGADRPKNVLVLMSDTGGGHRASAEAIRDAFQLEFGFEYRVFVKDLGKEYAGWPLNNMERTYKFLIKHVRLWKLAFHGTSPRWVHCLYLAALASYYAKEFEAGLMKYEPDIIISVHPLMQHIPLWVLKWQMFQKRVIFVTVITDLNTCHPTWFHNGVTRCYCPSEEVSKRASLEGLEPSQIRVFGLPIRLSFCRAILNKGDLREELQMDLNLPAVLVMGGGEGMGPVKETAIALGEALFDNKLGKPIGQIIVVCGRNQFLQSSLQSIHWKVPVKDEVLKLLWSFISYIIINGWTRHNS